MKPNRVLLALSIFFSLTTSAALPFLSQEDREEADYILEGRVIKVVEENHESDNDFSDYVYKVTMIITKTIKAPVLVDKKVTFKFWTAATRPEGLCGDMGQYISYRDGHTIRAGKTIKIYGYVDQEDLMLELISPNGFDGVEVVKDPMNDAPFYIE